MASTVRISRCLVFYNLGKSLKKSPIITVVLIQCIKGGVLSDIIPSTDVSFAERWRYSRERPRKEACFLSSRAGWKHIIVLVGTRNILPASCCDSPTARRKEQSEIEDHKDNGDSFKGVCGIFGTCSSWCTEAACRGLMQATWWKTSVNTGWSITEEMMVSNGKIYRRK